jgi:DNA topoisomerase IB
MKKRHVRVRDGVLYFDYPAKHGKRRIQAVVDPTLADDICTLKKRRGGGDELLAYRGQPSRGRWTDVKSADINAWLKDATGEDISAKDFRTWGATVLAALGLAVSPVPDTKTARRRAITRVVKEVAHYLGNTPAVARASYIDPRVFDRYTDGVTIAGVLPELGDDDDGTAIQGEVEDAVLELVTGEDRSPALAPPGGDVRAAA